MKKEGKTILENAYDSVQQSSGADPIARVVCSCRDCIHWVVGDLCGAREISLSKIPNDDYGAVVICETFEAGLSNEG